jgi:hypothetical protein
MDETLKDYSFVDIVSSSENWNEYLLVDGTLIRCKTIVSSIKKHKTAVDSEGIPRYVLTNQLIIDVRPKEA